MKRLITAAVVRQEKQAGKKRLDITLSECIVTPEARQVAGQIGLELAETAVPAPVQGKVQGKIQGKIQGKVQGKVQEKAPQSVPAPASGELAAIRAAILARVPAGSVSAQTLDRLIEQAVRDQASPPVRPASSPVQQVAPQGNGAGIKRVAGDRLAMGIFDGAGKENRVGIVDVVTAEDGSSMGAGFMAWENCFFPWTLTYDEVDLVLEGELHIRCNGETVVGKAGDVLFIPKNTSIEFGTPTRVKFFYVAYPANWQEV